MLSAGCGIGVLLEGEERIIQCHGSIRIHIAQCVHGLGIAGCGLDNTVQRGTQGGEGGIFAGGCVGIRKNAAIAHGESGSVQCRSCCHQFSDLGETHVQTGDIGQVEAQRLLAVSTHKGIVEIRHTDVGQGLDLLVHTLGNDGIIGGLAAVQVDLHVLIQLVERPAAVF